MILDHVIRDVDPKSPAAKAGLKDDDILVAVNGEQVDALDHESVVGKIKQSEEKTTLVVVDKETDAMYKLVSKCKLQLKIRHRIRHRSSNKLVCQSSLSYSKGLRCIQTSATLLALEYQITKHPHFWPLPCF